MNYNDVNTLLTPLIDEAKVSDFKIDIIFKKNDTSKTLNGDFTIKFTSDIGRASEFIFAHVFKLDLDHIRLKLKSKEDEGITSLPDFSKIEIIEHFANEIAMKYSEFKDWLYCYNKSGDDYDKIIEFIIRKKGFIMGRVYGL